MQEKKAEITYPTKWKYTIIGRDKSKIEDVVKEVMKDKKHTCTFSKTSKNGKFHSYNLECNVDSKEERDRIYKEINDSKDIDYLF